MNDPAFPKPYRYRDSANITRYKRAHPVCQACRKARTEDAHHLRSKSNFGGDEDENLIALCRRCHKAWADVDQTRREWFNERAANMDDATRTKVEAALEFMHDV